MLNKLLLSLCLFVVVAFLNSLQANSCLGDSQKKITKIYFANGVNVEEDDATEIADILELEYKELFDNINEEYVFDYAYNDTQGKFTDILQTLKQKMDEEGWNDDGLSPYQVFLWLQADFPESRIKFLIDVVDGIQDETILKTNITEASIERLSNSLNDSMADALMDEEETLSKHIDDYKEDLSKGKRVVVIAHSQGNLFTNAALKEIYANYPEYKDSIRSIGVASPASDNVGENIHITAHDDIVINILRIVEDVLPSNIDNGIGRTASLSNDGMVSVIIDGNLIIEDGRSLSNHFFYKDYFREVLLSRGAIDDELERLVAMMPFPWANLTRDGSMKVTLTWDGPDTDLDLHIYEPDGEHVYYNNMQGSDGFLDVNDTSGYGPETYYVPCENVQYGVYRFRVNYVSGSSAETATLTIEDIYADDPWGYTLTLDNAVGYDGDDDPIDVAKIEVEDGIGIDYPYDEYYFLRFPTNINVECDYADYPVCGRRPPTIIEVRP